MDKAEISNLQQQSVAQISEALPTLDRASLIELAAQEAAAPTPRTTLQAAIDKQLAALDAQDEGGDKDSTAVEGKGEPAAKPAGKLSIDDYRHPDYAGPLSGEQAAWRVANVKPVREARTK
ncbi:hypothetical protein [Dyella amyloliquefaciens]|uniref:hypothetical protein n=1 Tax=Dyella amyloliquefaciens TaxID=1770545 RepID=UPI00102E9E69|nr:hypothetical protein [Dyella amyloliquefaciens]